ncbi:MAG TPA: argininosuccinate synthase [Vicinamibacterales bacterium]|nr:argininosuccinate synthase [Vicinamibacterales bacterium]
MERIVLAYSGGLDTSVAIAWLREKYGGEVIAVTLDIGQGRELTDVRERALTVGATRAHVLDVRDEFARDYILPALQAGALYEDRYPLSTALGRPLIARRLVDVARMEGATVIAHGCNGKANDELRLELGVKALDPSITVLAPARIWGMTRPQEIEYARARRIPIPSAADSPYTIDTNLWGRSIERGGLEDPWQESPEDIYTLTRSPRDCPDEPAYVEIEFESGVPVRANGVEMSLIELIESVETIAGAHGVGRIDMVENATTGGKSREIYEAPAAVVLHTAHSELEKLVIPRDLERLGHDLGRAYADLVYNGRWFSPTREAIDAFMRAIQPRVTGAVRLKLFKGDCRVVGRRSPMALEAPAAPPAATAETTVH